MADISQIKILDGTQYNIKDATARELLNGHSVGKDVPANAVFTDTNTHRPIQVNGTEILGDNTTALNLKAGSNVTVTNSSGTVTIAATDTTALGSMTGTLSISHGGTGVTTAQAAANNFLASLSKSTADPTDTTNFIRQDTSGAPVFGKVPASSIYNYIKGKMPPVYYVEGPSTDTTVGTWTGTIDGLTAYYDGLTIIYVPAVAGASTTKLNINGLGAKTCYYTNTSALTTHFSVGTPILLTYINNAWRRADYDSNTNTLQRTYRSATNVELPIAGISTAASATAAYSAISSGSYKAVYGAIPETTANVATINPSTGKITIPGGINASNVYTKTEIDTMVGDVETLLAAI